MQGSHSFAYKKFHDFPGPDKQQLLTLYIQCDSRIHRKTFLTSCKETVQVAHSRNTSYIYLHMVFYT